MDLFGVLMALLMFTLVEAVVQKSIISTAGKSVILPCKAPSNMTVLAVEWLKHDLEDCVLAYRDGQFDPECQDASYKDRVDLKDVQNGDLSLLLRHVTPNDSGTYKCVAFQRGAKRRKRQAEVLSLIELSVNLSDGGGAVSGAGTEGNHLQWSLLAVGTVVIVILV